LNVLRVALALIAPGFAFGWGLEGHRLVVRLAETMLTPQARVQVAATLAPDESLSGLASWADDVRSWRKETAPWHYVDIPLHSTGLDMKRDCPMGNCLIGKIKDFREIWRDPAAGHESRREALLFLVHFVGDLHQPLHCEDHDDQGGNKVRVWAWGRETNLHAIWDSGILDHMAEEDSLFWTLSEAETPAHVTEWSGGTVAQWAEESFHLAQGTAYGLLPREQQDGLVSLPESYERAAQPVIELQLEKAGARLAAILNESVR
jgi:hypothetical protein